ncbi:N [Tospovirus kiwifruit/YXW/2014]|uniref:N n=1 Tax=Tospovirus kiwifruit/YXW/2014 TaxID=1857323 RepID=UPI0007E92343|nr:N [Tospovirus kiwifruit/YXW/2014] [Tospovirus kiwifruit/YXW/2014]ANJ02900.1 N [Tospovirus kiwifruit/YXW/2014] [Tospovirus kiwifruit/YXW/2014]
MSTVRGLTNQKIKDLLSGGKADVEIDSDDLTLGFNFNSFYEENKPAAEFTFVTGLNILKCRKQVFAACKSGKYEFCGKKIVATTDDVSATDWTFKRTEAFIRAKLISMIEKTGDETSKKQMYTKVMELPLVSAYGLNVPNEFSSAALRLMLCIGGPLPLLSSIPGLAPVCFPLAYFQNVKKEQLGIKNFSTYEQVCKIAKVLSASGVEFSDQVQELFSSVVKLLGDSNPGTAGAISLNKYNDQLKHMESAFNSKLNIDDYGQNSKPGSSKKPSKLAL